MSNDKAKFTPGPWTSTTGPSFATVHNVNGLHVTDIKGYGCTQEQNGANARLIAAAPDLLTALEKIDSNAAESVEWIRRVTREAINKATGGK